jgi:hypothetical protein
VPPKSITAGKGYLTREGRLRRVTDIRPDSEVRYRYRSFPAAKSRTWRSGTLAVETFAATVEREVPCDWRPEGDEALEAGKTST